jgi:hypothetical protein
VYRLSKPSELEFQIVCLELIEPKNCHKWPLLYAATQQRSNQYAATARSNGIDLPVALRRPPGGTM